MYYDSSKKLDLADPDFQKMLSCFRGFKGFSTLFIYNALRSYYWTHDINYESLVLAINDIIDIHNKTGKSFKECYEEMVNTDYAFC